MKWKLNSLQGSPTYSVSPISSHPPTHTHTFTHTHLLTHAHLLTPTYSHTHAPTYSHTRTHLLTATHLLTHTHPTTHIHPYTHSNPPTHTHAHPPTYSCTPTQLLTHTHTPTHLLTLTHLQTPTHLFTHAHPLTCWHTHIHPPTHTCILSFSKLQLQNTKREFILFIFLYTSHWQIRLQGLSPSMQNVKYILSFVKYYNCLKRDEWEVLYRPSPSFPYSVASSPSLLSVLCVIQISFPYIRLLHSSNIVNTDNTKRPPVLKTASS